MARDLPPATPSRRSKRFQPLATPSKARTDSLITDWSSEPIFIRPTIHQLDVIPDDRDGEDIDDREQETIFYDAFQMKPQSPIVPNRGAKGRKRAEMKTEVYRVGDTVLIETDTLSRTRRPPSIAVITAMWETCDKGSRDASNGSNMLLRVHWFLRPTELAGIRAKREHTEKEIYYSLNSSEILLPEVLLSHCTVTSQLPRNAETKTTDAWSIKRKPIKGNAFDSDSDVEDIRHDEPFYCHLAIDSRRGLFYNFEWEEHHQGALGYTPDNDAGYGNGDVWDVAIADEAPVQINQKPSTIRSIKTGSSRKRAKIVHYESESEDDATEDEYQASEHPEDNQDDMPVHAFDIESDVDLADFDDFEDPQTPSKNRKRKRATQSSTPRRSPTKSPTKRSTTIVPITTSTATPRKPRTTSARSLAQPTPHSKAALRQRQRANPPTTPRRRKTTIPIRVQPLSYAPNNLTHLPRDPWLRAMHALHVGSRPEALPCREEEYTKVLRCVGELVEEGSGGCVYISGVPGTGKTATVHATVRELKRMAECNETNPFTYVEINGLRLPEPSAAYSLLWEAVSGHDVAKDGHLKIGAKESLKALTRHFSGGGGRGKGPGGHACVVLMDELDQLVTAKQDVVYNFFNWPTLVGSKLVVLAVANTMDLPERVMTGRVRSRLGMIRINFQPYTTLQLEKIVQARLASVKGIVAEDGEDVQDVIAPDGIKFAAMKVSSISGDARRVLDICRRAVELVQPKRRTARMGDVKEVIQVMQNSPTAAYLRDCSFHERMMLASLVKCVKREGVEEIQWGEVQHQHLVYMNVLTSPTDPARKPTPNELGMVLDSLVASRAVLVEDGVAAGRKAESERRVMLNLEQGEVERVLGEVGGARWKGVLGTG